MSTTADPMGTLETALAHASRLLHTNPALALEQAQEILKVAPGYPPASLLLGVAWRRLGDGPRALEVLEALVKSQPRWANVHYELGLTLADSGQPEAALVALRRAVTLRPNMPDAWRAIGDQLTLCADREGADFAYAQHIKASTQDPRLLLPASALVDGKIPEAESILRAHLKQYPTDIAALRMLAEVATRLGRNSDAESLLEHCLELAPSFSAARHQYVIVLQRQNKTLAALRHLDQLAASEPHSTIYKNLRAVILGKIGEYRESIEIYSEVLKAHPYDSKIWVSYGHALATAGREADSVNAYRTAIREAPEFGEAYWSLANLKTFRFDANEIEHMRRQLQRTDLSDENRYHFDFALGKALEDAARYNESFQHYVEGNRLRRAEIGYDAEEMSAYVRRCKRLFTEDFFSQRTGWGAPDDDPIFIVGMPRAGSTLIEQILASHTGVEGTMELPDILMIAGSLSGKRVPNVEPKYPSILGTVEHGACRALGERYLADTRIQRKTSRHFFIDKMPLNFLHVGLILLILPNAKIIDARRHPMACCFSGFKQHFAQGHNYSFALDDIGHYYRDYVDLMAHFDRVMPGRIHRIFYESMIENTEREVRLLLDYCGLPFEDSCLRFYENDRPVRTPSAQQVRQPIYRSGIEQWRHFEPWLQPLKEALGTVLEAYPNTPDF
jgi:tetratricopeptide (TPR) repeat protein